MRERGLFTRARRTTRAERAKLINYGSRRDTPSTTLLNVIIPSASITVNGFHVRPRKQRRPRYCIEHVRLCLVARARAYRIDTASGEISCAAIRQ